MSITYEDIVKIGQEMQEQKDQWQRELFSCFKKADFERGDKILIGQLIAEQFRIPEWAKDRISISPFIPTDSYAVLVGDKKEKRTKWIFEDYAQPILKDPRGVVNLTGIA